MFSGYGCVNCRKMEASVWTDRVKISSTTIRLNYDGSGRQNAAASGVKWESGRITRLKTVGANGATCSAINSGQCTAVLHSVGQRRKPLGPICDEMWKNTSIYTDKLRNYRKNNRTDIPINGYNYRTQPSNRRYNQTI